MHNPHFRNTDSQNAAHFFLSARNCWIPHVFDPSLATHKGNLCLILTHMENHGYMSRGPCGTLSSSTATKPHREFLIKKSEKKNSIQNDVGVDRYFYSSESFTDHEVRTCIIVCTLVFLQRCSGLHSLVMNMTHSDAKCVFLSMNKKAIYCN